jgi:hypothetical protein
MDDTDAYQKKRQRRDGNNDGNSDDESEEEDDEELDPDEALFRQKSQVIKEEAKQQDVTQTPSTTAVTQKVTNGTVIKQEGVDTTL